MTWAALCLLPAATIALVGYIALEVADDVAHYGDNLTWKRVTLALLWMNGITCLGTALGVARWAFA